MYRSVTFGEKNTWNDWGLIPTSRPVVSTPAIKKVLIDIPGADGAIDLTQSLTGEVKYEKRKGSMEFMVFNKSHWANIYSEIMDYLHGQQVKIILEEDPDYYYFGRAEIDQWKSSKNYSLIVINIEADPYKYELYSSLEDWKWDSFNFETGIIREYRTLEVSGSLSIIIPGRRMSVCPSFTVISEDGAGMRIAFNGNTYLFADGTSRNLNIVLKQGTNTLQITGTGTISIDYRGGRL